MCCGNAYPHVIINVDHIKPVRKYWHLRLDFDNLQVLCSTCNKAKGNWDETDFRPKSKKSDSKRLKNIKIELHDSSASKDPAIKADSVRMVSSKMKDSQSSA